MKKVINVFLFAVFIAVLIPINKTFAVTEDEMNGDPMDNTNHFVWDLMASMQAPDDPDCSTLAATALEGTEGMTPEMIANVAGMACDSLAQMRTQMESDMSGMEGESVETNLFDATNWHSVENLYFEHSTNGTSDGRIDFSVPIDFMSYDFMSFMTSFGENMDASEGYISLDADVVGGFADYGATLTMYNVGDFNNPEILVNGGEDTDGVVSNLVYDRESNTITFNAAHFTEFEVVEGDEESDEEPEIDNIRIKKYFNPLAGKWIVKMILKGEEYDRSTEVTLGHRQPYKTKYVNNDKIKVYFSLDKLLRSGKDSFILRALNGNETEKFDKEIRLSKLELVYSKIK